MQRSDTIHHLEKLRDDLRQKIRAAVPDLFEQLEAIEKAIGELRLPPNVGEYTQYRSGVDALVSFLKKNGPTVRQDACKAVIAGGWAPTDKDSYWKLLDVVRGQLDRSKNAKIVLVKDNVIGLPEHVENTKIKRPSKRVTEK
jgi:hypothetical protein